jgi:hypothetical protein
VLRVPISSCCAAGNKFSKDAQYSVECGVAFIDTV